MMIGKFKISDMAIFSVLFVIGLCLVFNPVAYIKGQENKIMSDSQYKLISEMNCVYDEAVAASIKAFEGGKMADVKSALPVVESAIDRVLAAKVMSEFAPYREFLANSLINYQNTCKAIINRDKNTAQTYYSQALKETRNTVNVLEDCLIEAGVQYVRYNNSLRFTQYAKEGG